MPEHNDNTPQMRQEHRQEPSLSMIQFQLDQVINTVGEINEKFDVKEKERVEFLVWQERLEGRLLDGNRRMADTDKRIEVVNEHLEGELRASKVRVQGIKEQLEQKINTVDQKSEPYALDKVYVRKDTVKWIAFGFMLAGGGGAAFGHMIAKALGI